MAISHVAEGQRRGGSQMPFVMVEQGADCGVEKQGATTIRSRKELDRFLSKIGQTGSPAYSNTDWSRDQLVAVYGGRQPTTGYRVDVKRVVRETPGRTFVETLLVRPVPGAIVNPVITTPYTIVRMAKTSGAVQVKFLTD